MAKRSGLNKGFDSLLFENTTDTEKVITVRLSEIEPNRDQPRKEFDEAALLELSDSIKRHGLIQPLLVRPMLSGGYQLVAGERRWRACRMADIDEVPVTVREMTDGEMMELAMIENLQREDLNPIEEASGYKYLMDNYGLTQAEVAETCGKSRSAIANAIRLLALPDDILELIKIGALSAGHGRAILGIEDESLRELAVKMAQNGASVRELEKLSKKKTDSPKAQKEPKENFYKEMEIALKNDIGRRVKITPEKGEKGTISIEFYSKDDLRVLAEKLSEK